MGEFNVSRVEVLKLVAHPIRIAILGELSNGQVKCVSDLEEFLSARGGSAAGREISQPNICPAPCGTQTGWDY